MGMNLGTLFVTLEANATGFVKQMGESGEKLELFAKHAKKAAREVGEVGTVISALAGGALALAARRSEAAAMQLARMENASTALAMATSNALAPAFQAATRTIQGLANIVATMTPGQKQMLSTIVEVAAAVAFAATTFRVLASAVQGGMAIFSMFASGIAAVGVGPLLGIVVAIAAVIAAVIILHKAWRENWGDMQGIVQTVIDKVKTGFGAVLQFIAGVWNAQIAFMANGIQAIVDGLTLVIDKVAQWADNLGAVFDALSKIKGLGFLGSAGEGLHSAGSGLRAASSTIGDVGGNVSQLIGDFNVAQMGKNLGNSITTVASGVKVAGGSLASEAKLMLKPLLDIFDDLKSRFAGDKGTAGHAKTVGSADLYSWEGRSKDQDAWDAMQRNNRARAGGQNSGNRIGSGLTSVARSAYLQTGGEAPEMGLFDKGLAALATQFPRLAVFVEAAGTAIKEFAEHALSQAAAAIGQAGQNFAGKLGNLGSTIQAGVSGAQQGGPWGAIMGVLLEMFSQAKQFAQVLNAANGQFAQSLQALGPVFQELANGLTTLMGAIQPITVGLHTMIEPVLHILAGILKGIAPLFVEIGLILQAIAPSLQSLNSVMVVLQPVFWLLFQALKAVGLVVTALILGIEDTWNAILSALVQMLQAIEGSATWADGLRSTLAQMAVDTTATTDAMTTLLNTTYENAQAQATNTGAQLAAAGAAQNLTNSFQQMITNAPSGFRIGGYEYASQGNGGDNGLTVNGDVYVQSSDAKSFQKDLDAAAKQSRFQQTGRPF